MDLQKWLVGAGCCTALGISAGIFYVFNSFTQPVASAQYWYQQPLLAFFSGMLLLALMLNLLAVFGVDFHPAPLSPVPPPQNKQDFNDVALQFLQLHAATAIPGEANYFLHRQHSVLYYLQSGPEKALDIGQLRQIFQMMLRYQCESAIALVPEHLQSPAQIFALEANIRVLDQQQLYYRLQRKKT